MNKNDLSTAFVIILSTVMISGLLLISKSASDNRNKEINKARIVKNSYIKENNIKDAEITDIVSERANKTDSDEQRGFFLIVGRKHTTSESQEKRYVSKIAYKFSNHNKNVEIDDPDSLYINVSTNGEIKWIKKGDKPRITIKSYLDKESSKENSRFEIKREILLKLPEDYTFSDTFSLN